jgi:hypothetical protein
MSGGLRRSELRRIPRMTVLHLAFENRGMMATIAMWTYELLSEVPCVR